MRKLPTGSVYQKTYTDRRGHARKTSTWYLKYYIPGHPRPIDISSGTDNYDEAVRMLRQKMARAAAKGYEYTEDTDRVTVDQLLDLVIEDYQLNKRETTYDTEKRIDKHLRPYFGSKRATEIGTKLLKAYRVHRELTGCQPATINKELTFLRRGFRLGFEHEPRLVETVPHFPILKVDNAREGIVSHEIYRAIRDRLPSYARIAAVISYHTGARKGEIRKIRKERIDLPNARIELTRQNNKEQEASLFAGLRRYAGRNRNGHVLRRSEMSATRSAGGEAGLRLREELENGV
jgi:integrase